MRMRHYFNLYVILPTPISIALALEESILFGEVDGAALLAEEHLISYLM